MNYLRPNLSYVVLDPLYLGLDKSQLSQNMFHLACKAFPFSSDYSRY